MVRITGCHKLNSQSRGPRHFRGKFVPNRVLVAFRPLGNEYGCKNRPSRWSFVGLKLLPMVYIKHFWIVNMAAPQDMGYRLFYRIFSYISAILLSGRSKCMGERKSQRVHDIMAQISSLLPPIHFKMSEHVTILDR